ncbi:MAG: hypothetical protein ABJL54_13845 [Halioglobus sp.]
MDPFLQPEEAENMLRIAESFGSFGTYAEEATSDGLGESLPQRFDVGLNYVAHGLDGGGNHDDLETAKSRSNYFRETYAYGNEKCVTGVEAFLEHPKMQRAAREISACEEIVPAIVYANLLIPGQELAIHTDVPEFRGANRKNAPQWLLVCMLHSGLFDRWRVRILTCVSWFGTAKGGAFTFYPNGANGAREAIPAQHNSAILIDTDKVFHGVERVAQRLPELPPIEAGTRLYHLDDDDWALRAGNQTLARYSWPQIRYSISWKGYCFKDQEERSLWESGSDDLTLDQIIDLFERDLRQSGRMKGDRPEPDDFAQMMVETYIHYPEAGR